ncbi:hypothetical protein Xvie_01427 [Xenorhabdus vietnamensis]|uniref:Uncharacterized protein n=1 Tax=Xenorhabdus vietnamensis TaxID=351656 RepID=A0A1Y2SEI0_9GAMM|nr:hypothetical protein Xvie_01427 [Xenorhabdus vietnamensis]
MMSMVTATYIALVRRLKIIVNDNLLSPFLLSVLLTPRPAGRGFIISEDIEKFFLLHVSDFFFKAFFSLVYGKGVT